MELKENLDVICNYMGRSLNGTTLPIDDYDGDDAELIDLLEEISEYESTIVEYQALDIDKITEEVIMNANEDKEHLDSLIEEAELIFDTKEDLRDKREDSFLSSGEREIIENEKREQGMDIYEPYNYEEEELEEDDFYYEDMD